MNLSFSVHRNDIHRFDVDTDRDGSYSRNHGKTSYHFRYFEYTSYVLNSISFTVISSTWIYYHSRPRTSRSNYLVNLRLRHTDNCLHSSDIHLTVEIHIIFWRSSRKPFFSTTRQRRFSYCNKIFIIWAVVIKMFDIASTLSIFLKCFFIVVSICFRRWRSSVLLICQIYLVLYRWSLTTDPSRWLCFSLTSFIHYSWTQDFRRSPWINFVNIWSCTRFSFVVSGVQMILITDSRQIKCRSTCITPTFTSNTTYLRVSSSFTVVSTISMRLLIIVWIIP